MKSRLLIWCCMVLMHANLHAQWPYDTVMHGITLSYNNSTAIFPDYWRINPINAKAERLGNSEISRTKEVMQKALAKYPGSLLKDNLRAVYFLKSIRFYNVLYGGTNSPDAVYLADAGTKRGYTDHYLEQTFHHEFSSILYRNFSSWIDTSAWLSINETGFNYLDPDNGIGAIKTNKSSQELDHSLCEKGFLTEYSLSSMENDLNTIAQNLFRPAEDFWKLVDTYPRLRKKTTLLISFYHSLDPVFSESYFRKL